MVEPTTATLLAAFAIGVGTRPYPVLFVSPIIGMAALIRSLTRISYRNGFARLAFFRRRAIFGPRKVIAAHLAP